MCIDRCNTISIMNSRLKCGKLVYWFKCVHEFCIILRRAPERNHSASSIPACYIFGNSSTLSILHLLESLYDAQTNHIMGPITHATFLKLIN